jgi:hypothetical protein
MTLVEFAEQYPVHTRKDECGETIIPGKLWKEQPKAGRMYGHQIYEHGNGRLGCCSFFPWKMLRKLAARVDPQSG